jgi:endonuclease YncB( thermonuclease family)
VILSFLCLSLPARLTTARLATAQPAKPEQPVKAPALISVEGLVVGVSEGDRLTVNSFGNAIDVQLYGVAAPHTAKVDKFTGWYKAGQPYAEDAFRALSIKVLHQQVKVDIRRTVVFNDVHKQMAVAIIFLDGRNINLEMLSEGWGWADSKLTSPADFPRYLAVQKLARARRQGLWLQDNPQPPWNFKPELKLKMKHGR